MRSTLAAAFVSLVSATYAWQTTTTPTLTSTPSTTGPTCPIITQTGGPGCPTPSSNCTVADCITLVQVTQPCTCARSLSTTTVCETTCHQGCQTTTSVLRIPCPTSLSSSSSAESSSSASSSCTGYSCLSSSSWSYLTSSSSCTGVSCMTSPTASSSTSTCTVSSCLASSTTSSSPSTSPTTSPIYSNSTATVTSITTLTTCPYNDKCHGQTTTWSGSKGPFSCTATLTCTCVLPGGISATITGPTTTPSGSGPTTATEVTIVGQSTTSSVTGGTKPTSTTGSTPSSWGEKNYADGWIAMIVAGLLGVL